MTTDLIRWYDAHAPELARSYESIRAEQLHAWMADLLPQGKGQRGGLGSSGRELQSSPFGESPHPNSAHAAA